MKRKNSVFEIRKKIHNNYKIGTTGSLPVDEILTDTRLEQWKIGRTIGTGGFGEIYLASDDITKPVGGDAKYVVKVEPFSSGPLFVEIHFYANVGKKHLIDQWISDRKLKSFGMPHYLGFGSHYYNDERYRFIVLPRYGTDIQSLFVQNGNHFNLKTAFTLAVYIIDVLEYIHHNGYVHADIKGSNLVLSENNLKPVYLIDYGLACKFYNDMGKHKRLECDERKAHTGTLEFTSRDAHLGAHSRRGDLEVLGYNIIKWMTGSLPWEGTLDMDEVAEIKKEKMADIRLFLNECFHIGNLQPPDELVEFFKYINSLKFKAQPDYDKCRNLFQNGVKNAGFKFNGELPLNIAANSRPRKRSARSSERENDAKLRKFCKVPPVVPPRKPCTPKNIQCRLTRKSTHNPFQFDWPAILRGHPEKPTIPLSIYERVDHNIVRSYVNGCGNAEEQSYVGYEPDTRGLDNPTPEMLRLLNNNNCRSSGNRLAPIVNNNNPIHNNSNYLFNGHYVNGHHGGNLTNDDGYCTRRSSSAESCRRSISPELKTVKRRKIDRKKTSASGAVRNAPAAEPSKAKIAVLPRRRPAITKKTIKNSFPVSTRKIKLRSSIRKCTTVAAAASTMIAATVPVKKVKKVVIKKNECSSSQTVNKRAKSNNKVSISKIDSKCDVTKISLRKRRAGVSSSKNRD